MNSERFFYCKCSFISNLYFSEFNDKHDIKIYLTKKNCINISDIEKNEF